MTSSPLRDQKPSQPRRTRPVDEMKAFAEGMDAKLERVTTEMNRRFDSVERQLGLLTDAVRTH